MKTEHSVSAATWIDLHSPTKDEILSLLEDRKIPISFVDELVSKSERPMTVISGGVLLAIFQFPVSHKKSEDIYEVDFLVGKDFVVTCHYESVPALEHFASLVEVENITDHQKVTASDGPLLFSAILTRIYETVYDEIEVVESSVLEAEENIFSGHEKDMVFVLSKLSRIVLNFRKSLDSHERIIKQISEFSEKYFGEMYKASILNSFEKVKSAIKNEGEIIKELQATNLALLETKQNEIMKALTVLASLLLPMSFVAALFTIPAKFKPILGMPNDFLIVSLIMVVVALGLLVFMKLRKWI